MVYYKAISNFKNQMCNIDKGALRLPQQKKILLTLPDSLLRELDNLAREDNVTRSGLILEAMNAYIANREETARLEKIKRGYMEMSEINSDIAELCFEADSEILCRYEEKLAECEHT